MSIGNPLSGDSSPSRSPYSLVLAGKLFFTSPSLCKDEGIYTRVDLSPLQNAILEVKSKFMVPNQYILSKQDFVLQETPTLGFSLVFILGYVLSFIGFQHVKKG